MNFRRFHGSRPDDPDVPLVDLADIFADDQLVEALRTSGSPPADQADGCPDQLLDLLSDWRADALAMPMPPLPAVPRRPGRAARSSRGHRRSLRPVLAIAGAIAGMLLGSAVVSAREAQPGDALFGLTTAVWPREAALASALVDVRVATETAESAVESGDTSAAQSSLDGAQEALSRVDEADRPASLNARLADIRAQLDVEQPSSPEPAAGSDATPSVTRVQEYAAAPPAPENPPDHVVAGGSAATGEASPPSMASSTAAAAAAPSTTDAGSPSATEPSPAAAGSSVAATSSAPSTGTSAPGSTSAPATSDPADTTETVTSTRAVPVPGLPQVKPLPSNVLLGTRTVDGHEDIYQIDATTGAVGTKLTTHTTGPLVSILSPDRGSVLYVDAGAESQLRSVAVDGTGDRPLFAAPAVGCQTILRPAWNPIDGSELAVVCVAADGTTELKLVGVDGTVRSTLHLGMAFIDDVSFSPDGKTLLYWGSPNKGAVGGALFRERTDGSGNPQQITTPGAANDGDATFAPDGTTIVFRRATTAGNGATVSQIFTVQADGLGLTPVTDGTSIDEDPTVSPDGTQIAFRSNRNNAAGTADTQIWVIGIDGTGLRELGIGSPGRASGPPVWGHR
jgi:dipeptidyl aminopeptidase/acylaminoacyl peptidase